MITFVVLIICETALQSDMSFVTVINVILICTTM